MPKLIDDVTKTVKSELLESVGLTCDGSDDHEKDIPTIGKFVLKGRSTRRSIIASSDDHLRFQIVLTFVRRVLSSQEVFRPFSF